MNKDSASLSPHRFEGFPSGKVRFVSIPSAFFAELLPLIDHLGELKVTLYALWFVEQMEGTFRYVQMDDFWNDATLMSGLGSTQAEARQTLEESLERAVHRGSLLKVAGSQEGGQPVACFFINSPKGRAGIQAIQNGDWSPGLELRQPVALNIERPNIFRLYEEHIGPLTPMISETLREAEQTYPEQWIEDAVRIAVENNVRRWRYIDAILRSWQEGGRNEQNRGNTPKDRRRYVEGDFADYIEH